jgi:hypothetical protein
LREVENRTPFAHFAFDKMGAGRRFFDVVLLKGTLALTPDRIVPAVDQLPIVLGDDLWDPDHAERSSLKHAGEVVLVKPTTDVIVTGKALAPGGTLRAGWTAGVEITSGAGTKLTYRAQAMGPRRWRHGEKGWTLSEPEPTAEVPIRYELAYGGAYQVKRGEGEPSWVVHPENPSGVGFFDEGALDTAREYPAPQWIPHEAPAPEMNRAIPLAGFGPVARPWRSRLQYAGTYDDDWKRRMAEDIAAGRPADYPADFDTRFFQCAPPGLVTPEHLIGDEVFTLTGLMPGAEPYTFQLPCVRMIAGMLDGKNEEHQEGMPLDTVQIDLDAGLVNLCWRLTLDQARDIRAALIRVARIT